MNRMNKMSEKKDVFRGKTVQNKSFLNKIKGSCQFYNLIIIKGRHITL